MDTLTLLQHYWWFVVSLLGALLVFLLFVQGGQTLLYGTARTDEERTLLVNALGRKWELTYTTLVTFGGAFFASFPLFYSTSFGGAVYLWLLILAVFVLQAVAYEFRSKPGNLFGRKTYDLFLMINGIAGPLLLGAAVGTLFTGAPFTVDRFQLVEPGGTPVISQWESPWHGLEAFALLPNWLLGCSVALLAQVLGCQYLMNAVADEQLAARLRRRHRVAAALFVPLFLGFLGWLLTTDGPAVDPTTGLVSAEPYKYLHNLLAMPAIAAVLLAGIVLTLAGILLGRRGSRRAIWFGGAGAVLAVLGLLLAAGWNDTAYYPSLTQMQSSLTLYNSSSSLFTLRVMAWVTLLVPFVAAYIVCAWRALNRRPVTRDEMRREEERY